MRRRRRRLRPRDLLIASLRRHESRLLGFAGWSIVEAVPALLSGRLVASAIDDGFLAGSAGTGLKWLAVLAVCILLGAWGTRRAYLRLSSVVEPFRDELVTLVVRGAVSRAARLAKRGDAASVARLTHQVEIVRDAYGSLLMLGQSFLVTTVSALIGLVTLAPEVLVFVVPPLLAALCLFFVALAATSARQKALILANEAIAETVATVAGGLRDVVACGAEGRVEAAARTQIEAQARETINVAKWSAFRSLALGVGGWLPLVLILAGGPWLLRRGATTGAVLGALTYVLQGVQPALQTLVRSVGDSGLWLAVTLRRILEAAQEPNTGRDVGLPLLRAERPLGIGLQLRGLTFAYGESGEAVIRDLDLAVPEGDHLAIVGPSGVGKSTLAGLIAGMLEPQAGEVRLGGLPLDQIEPPELTQLRVLVPQEAYVFEGTLRENLSYHRPDATRTELDDAVLALGLWPLVRRVGGYDAKIRAATLSAGERQSITLIRAYLAPAGLVLLDEATCHLDPAAEAWAEQAFARRRGTLIVIAHRMSSALRARRILVLDGTRVMVGTHEELLTTSPLYRELLGHWEADGGAADREVVGVS